MTRTTKNYFLKIFPPLSLIKIYVSFTELTYQYLALFTGTNSPTDFSISVVTRVIKTIQVEEENDKRLISKDIITYSLLFESDTSYIAEGKALYFGVQYCIQYNIPNIELISFSIFFLK